MILNTALKNAWLATGSLKSLIDTGFIYLYSGPVPADADVAPDVNCVKLVKVDAGAGAGPGVTWNGAPTNGVLQKTGTETWSGNELASGTMTFFRYCQGTDDGSGVSDGAQYRLQGTIGSDATFDLDSNTITQSGNLYTLNTGELLI